MAVTDGASFKTIDHGKLGLFRGVKCSEKATQYLGVQYATLKDRFSRGELVEPSSNTVSQKITDATKLGPTVLIPPNACESEQNLVQKSLPFSPIKGSDKLGLTLNITVPESKHEGLTPVLVFIHGGGFTTGSSSFPQVDLRRITELSVNAGMPICAIGVNYRVGAPGFLHAPVMKAAGYYPNNGLHDQRLALLWIKNYIEGFGGDPTKITLLGESAGATSGSFHLHSPDPLFQQFVAMSGSTLLRPRPVKAVERSFGQIAELLGAKDKPPEAQLQALLEEPADDFVNKIGRKFVVGPIVDDDIIPSMTSYSILSNPDATQRLFPGLRSCKRILIGDCEMDGMIWGLRVAARKESLPKFFKDCLSQVIDPIDSKLTQTILDAYGIDPSVSLNTHNSTLPVLQFGHDITFTLPALSYARAFSAQKTPATEVFLYHFNAPNPWDGPWKGYATHVQDLVFLLQNYREHLSPGQSECAERFAQDVISFANERDPWPRLSDQEAAVSMVYTAAAEGDKDESRYVADSDTDFTHRRNILTEVVSDPNLLDKLLDAWQLFMRGPQ